MLTEAIKKSIQDSVLCWLATSDTEGMPNVSPKELFTFYGEDQILVANIASPQSLKNIRQNPNVCISFIDIFVQKGFQIKGTARIIDQKEEAFEALHAVLFEMAGERFPFSSLTSIQIQKVKPIIAPSYFMYPESTTEESQVHSALKRYGVRLAK